ncbi:hypothetical protein [Aquicoccus sp.]|uniref:hypothetical protein n=1 Tax=Aquicoccus sp. TaxID=2055851 RepID=UPI0035648B1A
MKRALATLATTVALATGASAMVGPYERAVNENQTGLFTEGEKAQARSGARAGTNSPAAGHDGNGKITIFRLRSGKAASSLATDVPGSPSSGR